MIYLLVFAVSGLLTWWFSSAQSPFQIDDRPNERSLHEHPVPRSGGIALPWGWMGWMISFPGIIWMLNLFNFPPARIFMGDTGSATLGLLVAGFSLWGIRVDLFPLWFPMLVFSPFIVDATVTLIRRVLRKEKVWQAHRTHYYQRLSLAGWGHRKTVVVEYGLMLATGLSAIAMLQCPSFRVASLIIWSVVYILLAYAADVYCVKQKGGVK